MPGPLLLSRFEVEANMWTFDLEIDSQTDAAIPIPAGNYYLDSPTAAESLVAVIEDAIETRSAGEDFTVVFDTTTGKITFATSTLSTTWGITFNQVSLAQALGFGAGTGFGPIAGSSQVGSEVCQYLIFADGGREDYTDEDYDFGLHVESAGSGPAAGVGDGSEDVFCAWKHVFEPNGYMTSPYVASGTRNPARTTPSTSPVSVRPWAWSDFFRHHAKGANAVQPFRVYDRGGSISLYEGPWILKNGVLRPRPKDHSNRRFWVVSIEVQKQGTA